jgi:hypothetical protein
MVYAASIQNFETGNLSGLQSRRLTGHYITKAASGQNGGQSREVRDGREGVGGKP